MRTDRRKVGRGHGSLRVGEEVEVDSGGGAKREQRKEQVKAEQDGRCDREQQSRAGRRRTMQ